jgi:hypothetical protein
MAARTTEISNQMRSGAEVARDDVLVLDGAFRGALVARWAGGCCDGF